jgi:endonuclease YncB( thermonuclease family)
MGNFIEKGRLSKATLQNTPKYTFNNETHYCKVLKVYDGDTITIAIKLSKKYVKSSVRMLGYDSPEMKPPKNQTNREEEIKAAKRAKEALGNLILNKIVKIKLGDFDKYGRLLGTVIVDKGFLCCQTHLNVNQYMIDNNFGYPYQGGTKKKFKK